MCGRSSREVADTEFFAGVTSGHELHISESLPWSGGRTGLLKNKIGVETKMYSVLACKSCNPFLTTTGWQGQSEAHSS
jgi:hypothetical protein